MRSLLAPAAVSDWFLVPIEVAVGLLYFWIASRLIRRRRRPGPSGGTTVRHVPFPSVACTDVMEKRKAA